MSWRSAGTLAANESSEFGLKDDWVTIQETLERIIPVYDKTNRYISLGTDLKLRRRGMDLLVGSMGREDFSVLDLGCGTGKMSVQLISRCSKGNLALALMDPLVRMMKVARAKTRLDGVVSVFENMPFKSSSFDAAMAGFSIRDARILSSALSETYKLLVPSGRFLIVDLAKPDSSVRIFFIGFYWRVIAPAIAFLVSGRLGLKFGDLATTFKRLPKKSELQKLAKRSGFEILSAEYSMLGGACVLLLGKQEGNPESF
ncbi:MAG: class I SAM-dependent methyltransferase [Nitrososphaerota archaeon]|jgi:demethylmenaquinone methyltransferase/2-methoxy-6-polyprenyl-1,4-benzoquinol methylase|nr:class I SAM-dependent methyltransferase [Nitrososphaerota archaeon]MDG6921887.1 class I SAM-dependent methyltransferase [Nitrososphaerota archaeon]